MANPDDNLDDGFQTLAKVAAAKSNKPIKANTFMALKSNLDDERMFKVKKDGRKYIRDTYSVREREVMMGLPEGYVQNTVEHLFKKLTEEGFLKPETEPGASYKTFLDPDLLHFAKQCRFNVKPKCEPPFFQIEIKNDLLSINDEEGEGYYDEEEYSKHLVGNGWSIPVVEHLLEPLRGLFHDDSFLQIYDNYDYNFPWEPYTSKENAQPIQEAEI